jgi:VIT1/CCC1 family predicted Fe2+/Mn2+ transporter
MKHQETHRVHRVGWLRAAVLGANDGIVSTASLLIGVAAADAERGDLLVAGVAGLVAGAMSMAAGEIVSVSSQRDTEQADLAREQRELETTPARELAELTGIYIGRGLDPELAHQVAVQLSAKDALAAHARDELGITDALAARPVQAALSSAAAFAVGAGVPLLIAVAAPLTAVIPALAGSSLLLLAALGAASARAGGAPMGAAMARVTAWGALAMGLTAGIGALLGTVV